ncbi:site-2 protease family protein [Virgibacillus sp. NKC19-16]|uniref:site-2 protease family protein n=1 Tax=Virgibacillus salidurans TaxID=2831673 RepID=UPI001F1BDDB1|nr:site-2 protease family protein [Virgibacillus sp. NKC19-16]UJL44757.1 site-2 protease family protein [Virgibacillus sp. NKC19-16]
MDIYLLLYLVFIVAPLSSLLHEAGHAAAARTVGADQITLSIGLGKRINTVIFAKVQIIFHAIFFLGGLAKSERAVPYKSWEIVWITIVGPITNALFALLFYILYVMYPNDYLQLLFLFNIWLAFVNSIPFKIKERRSDGYLILQTISKKNTPFKFKHK